MKVNEKQSLLQDIFGSLGDRKRIRFNWGGPTPGDPTPDDVVEIWIDGKRERFPAVFRKEVRPHQFDAILSELREQDDGHPMLVAERLFPKVKEMLREEGVSYMEGGGNVYIRTERNLIWIEGGKRGRPSPGKMKNRAFSQTGLKVLFLFLLDQNAVNLPYRRIAEELDIAVGNVGYVKQGLKEAGFLVQEDRKRSRLIQKRELLDRFVTAYEDTLKPKLFLGSYSFFNEEDRKQWRFFSGFEEGNSLWGEEPAAHILREDLRPERFAIYTEERLKELTKRLRLIPDPEGDVRVYQKFWSFQLDEPNLGIVPPLLVYTDLMNSGDSRCQKVGREIFEDYLEEFNTS